MKVTFLLFVLLHIIWAAPQLKFTPEEYKAFQIALNGRRPLFLQSAYPVVANKNIKNTGKYVYVNIGGKDAGGIVRVTPGGKTLFPNRQIIGNLHRGGVLEGMVFPSQNRRESEVLLPIFRNEVEHISPDNKRVPYTIGKKLRKMKRIKRDTYGTTYVEVKKEEEEEELEPIRYAEELNFGLSTGGGVVGGAVGGYLDTTGAATKRLIQSLESVGLIALTQLDAFLDRQEKEKRLASRPNTNHYY